MREEAVTVLIEGVGSVTLLCTPTDIEALALGFAFSEGLIAGKEDVAQIGVSRASPWTRVVSLRLARPPAQDLQRNLMVTSSCGACGSRNIEEGLAGAKVGDTLRVAAGRLLALAEAMRQQQAVFQRTGGTHASILFAADGSVAAFAEDIGRHNTLDKVLGKRIAEGLAFSGYGVMMSGRVSYELVAKAARAGLEIVAGVSAPSSLAVDAALQRNITLCGFVREDRVTVFTGPQRITH